MTEIRKGVFTSEQEQLIDSLYESKGLTEVIDGVVIKTIDNVFIEKLKAKLPEEYLPTLYQIVDEIMDSLSEYLKK